MGRKFAINGDLESDDFAADYVDGAADVPSLRTLGTGSTQAAAGDHTHGGTYQPLDADLTALAASPSTAGLVERTGAATYTTRLIGVANAPDVPTRADADGRYATSGHTHAGVYQPSDAGLTSLAALPTAADRVAYSTAADTWAETALSAFGRTLIDDADAATALTTLGAQPSDATLTSIAALGTAADKMLYTTGVDTFAEASLTAAGRALLDDATAADQRTTLGLGTAATANTGTGSTNVPTVADANTLYTSTGLALALGLGVITP